MPTRAELRTHELRNACITAAGGLADDITRLDADGDYTRVILRFLARLAFSETVRAFYDSLEPVYFALRFESLLFPHPTAVYWTPSIFVTLQAQTDYLTAAGEYHGLNFFDVLMPDHSVGEIRGYRPLLLSIDEQPPSRSNKGLEEAGSMCSLSISYRAKSALLGFNPDPEITVEDIFELSAKLIGKQRSLVSVLFPCLERYYSPHSLRGVAALQVPNWLFALANLLRFHRDKDLVPSTVLFVPVGWLLNDIGVACCASKRRLSLRHCQEFEMFVLEIAQTIRSVERHLLSKRESDLRAHEILGLLSSHDARGALAHQQLTLLELKSTINEEQVAIKDLVREAEVAGERAIERLLWLEEELKSSSEHTCVMKHPEQLEQELKKLIPTSAMLHCAIWYDSADVDLEITLDASLQALAATLAPLITNALVSVKDQDSDSAGARERRLRFAQNLRQRGRDPADELYVLIEITPMGSSARNVLGRTGPIHNGSIAVFIFDCGPGLPPDVFQVLKNVPYTGKLPSTKVHGGRGLLSSLSAVQNLFRGTWNYYPETGWYIRVPGVVRKIKKWHTG
jgi:hypothetical protein